MTSKLLPFGAVGAGGGNGLRHVEHMDGPEALSRRRSGSIQLLAEALAEAVALTEV